ncbi:hypothetical protein EIH07_05110 [Chryseobacterium taklimakanense]|uniref:hypothetical protein n=1 Tax=Chryseobacterium taklimakanense TaxID=536441 RepID=UPI000F5DE852|nr:hypothetical protein [Chryseobacterium taklimakanense]AZI22464.1 hypothetical protein EIH07_05110 [Chryseobacterium taklimakanense]
MKIIILLSVILSFVSCKKEIIAKKGGLDIISNIYIGASKNLENRRSFLISRLNYSGDSIVEIVPEPEIPEMSRHLFFIKDSVFYPLELAGNLLLSEISKKTKPSLVFDKKAGAIFSKDPIPNYGNRRNLSDTILFNKKFRRFEINSPWNYTRYYVYPTDTILPYAIYRHAEQDYSGRIERIDSYNKKDDVFVSMQLIPRKNWDNEAKEIFEFNHFATQRK